MFYLNARPACSTHKVAVDALEDLLRGHHLIKTHLNPEIRRKNFRSPDTPARWSWLPPHPSACSSWTPSMPTPQFEAAPWCQGSQLTQICDCHPWTYSSRICRESLSVLRTPCQLFCCFSRFVLESKVCSRCCHQKPHHFSIPFKNML